MRRISEERISRLVEPYLLAGSAVFQFVVRARLDTDAPLTRGWQVSVVR